MVLIDVFVALLIGCVGRLVDRSVIIYKKRREVTLPCSYRSTCSDLGVLCSGKEGHVRVSGAVDDPLGQDDPPPRLGLHNDALDGVVLHDDVHRVAVQQRPGGRQQNLY